MTKVSSKGNLLIVGAGQYGQVAREIAESMDCFEKISFLDDKHPDAVGRTDQYSEFAEQYPNAIVAIGRADLRLSLTQQLRDAGYQIAALNSPMAYVSASAVIREGCVIEPMAVVHTESEIGECCFISAGAVVNHNCVIGSGCHIDCHATVKSNTVLGDQTKIDYGQVISNG